jgi:hypothetical protein
MQGIGIIWVSSHTISFEVEGDGYIFEVLEDDCLLIAALHEQRAKVDLAHIKYDVWFNHGAYDQEVLHDLLGRNLECPERFMSAHLIGVVLEDHLAFLA